MTDRSRSRASRLLRGSRFPHRRPVVALRRSKTDQDGAGLWGIPVSSTPHTRPVRALRALLEAAGVVAGSVFRPENPATARRSPVGSPLLT